MSSRIKRFFFLAAGLVSIFILHTVIVNRSDFSWNNKNEKSSTDNTSNQAQTPEWPQGGHSGSSSTNSTLVDTPDGLLRAGLVALVRNSELEGMRSTIRQVDDRFNRNYGYPYIFLNDDDFSEEFMREMRAITKAPVYFGKLPREHWGLSPYVTEEKVRESLERNKDRFLYGGSYSYRLMCRFQSGFVHKHPLLQNLEYYWRIEPSVDYFCDIPYDPFKYMRDNKLVYGYTISPMEAALTVETLWETTRHWMLENPQFIPDQSFMYWVVNEKAKYTLCHFWSNFEIVDLSFYRSEAYQSYFDYLDKAGGFFYERWGDAPVHSMAAALLLRKEQIHWFEDIGYHHPGYSHCPEKPDMRSRCVCKGKSDYMYKSVCNRRFGEVDNISKDRALELAHMPDLK
ncbi:alpha 1,2-mannosyltransferase 2.4.1 [Coemansia sp. RSA 1722]|nr:alpha 1,2-mannosyltransferase 2.4.1 [Coemansia sp. RSA 486]KAJ2238057.1 alpha 1,2-mannosyltransferase 2.4.1 [Coemansia sp. RSA 485]KAJ2603583.1 alpha 1,2-mannosyltransferase 2.4.1 [Coemansia sp. RSA 1721]KAJ2606186.1 alpha 1,2-mannosyltransferase 2.4.1 [Coemansia sp. RSA 1722]KAJ2639691.1 alpha 1,2-mannosyltransferase 2.4.1 [Coemansia sp. RSA 1286]